MKKILLSLAGILTLIICDAQNLLRDPQKIVIDSVRNRFIVSNFSSGGDLIIIDSLGNQDTLVENAGMVDGLDIVGDTVYGSGPYPSGKVKGYNLITGDLVMDVAINGVQHLSSFIHDDEGMLYASERFGDRIFKINPVTKEYWVFAQGGGLDEPNGLLLEPENNRMLVCLDQSPPKILSVNLSDSTVSEVVTLNIEGSDGIIKVPNGNYYITGYELSGMYKCDPDFSEEPELVFQHEHMIYPTYNSKNNSILVTLYSDDDWAEIPVEENALDEPESVVYDEKYDRYLVSSCGHGKIIQIDDLGQQSYFNTAVKYTLGLHIFNDTVYVSSNDGALKGVVGMPLETRGVTFNAKIPEQELLNDITSDNSGNLYVTDCDANKVYKVRIEETSYTNFVSSGLGYPNGILFDESNNRLLVLNCMLAGYPITAVSLVDSTVTNVVNTNISAIDGFDTDSNGYYYFSSWTTDKVYRYDESFTNPPEVVSEGHNDPADISINEQENLLLIPNYSSNQIDFVPIPPIGVVERRRESPMVSVFPNPFSGNIRIDFVVEQNSRVNIEIMDYMGETVQELINKQYNPGIYSIGWNGCNSQGVDMGPGCYFVKIKTDNQCDTLKIIKQ